MDNVTNFSAELKDTNLTISSNKFPFNLYLAKNNPQNLSKNSKYSDNSGFTSLVSKLEDFLPKIANANEELLSLSKDEVDIEQVEDQDQIIEMNLQLYEDSSDSDSSGTQDDLTALNTEISPEHIQKPLIIEEEKTTNN
ncbi:hypothetical protein LOD99_1729 [Oopsacas minuta]|uniref:Uncharacterized protein n=1 Tax=Oopsacas minuta TaxID=111878 RepID=A0AAV7K4G7_9METZ|nr:hypothetical protein LOD99_1729 [Oopsacas minuta]